MRQVVEYKKLALSLLLGLSLVACAAAPDDETPGALPPTATIPTPPPSPPTTPPEVVNPIAEKPTDEDAVRFLMSASFGPTENSMNELIEMGYSDWLKAQLQLPMRSIVDASWPTLNPVRGDRGEHKIPINEFYRNAILGEDQLRMRATYSLSQVLVISPDGNNTIAEDGEGFARYIDILQEGAFGNFRDLLERVTYSPMMGEYLTFAGNRKANPEMGSAPDENYAREIMQLFTIGLYELNSDGTLRLDAQGRPVETYSNNDITELAKVFTGLWWDELPFGEQRNLRTQQSSISPMTMHELYNSDGQKNVLGHVIPAELNGNEAISAALDILFEHPNTAPFISSRLIQRMTTSNPSPGYVERVATAFNLGIHELPDGEMVGSGERGDLTAVWAAILLDEEYLASGARSDPTYGKVREPVLRFTHWARFAGVPDVHWIEGSIEVDTYVMRHDASDRLGQRAFTSPSVFNFYRPGYAAPGSKTAEFDLVAPELQITDENSMVSYANFMRTLTFRDPGDGSRHGPFTFVGDFSAEIELANDPAALVDRLDLLLTGGTIEEENRVRISLAIESVPISTANRDEALRNRVQLAVLLTTVSPEFLVQQ